MIDGLSVVTVPAGGMFASGDDGALRGVQVAPPLLYLEDVPLEDVPIVIDEQDILSDLPASPPRPGPAPRMTQSSQQQTGSTQSARASSGDHSYLTQTTSSSKKRVTPKRPPPSSSSERKAYRALMREKKRILRLEAMILHEAKKKEAEYWHLMKLKLVTDITGEQIDLSDLQISTGPLLNGELAQAIYNSDNDPLDRNVNIVCTFNFFSFYKEKFEISFNYL